MLWETWNMAKSYSCRPSDLLAVKGDVAAYHTDRAVMLFGRALETEIEAIQMNDKMSDSFKKKSQDDLLNKWLELTPDDGKSGYADPAMKFKG